jgi:pimeloyl-ACP methyl ester carboxylesterase
MKFSISWSIICALCRLPLAQSDGYGPYHFKAHFGSSPAPTTIDVDPSFINETRLKASLTRNPIDIDIMPFTEGVPSHNLTSIRDYWVHKYDWTKVQHEINDDFHHFTTTVGPLSPDFSYDRSIELHFVHHRSQRPDAIPLLFIHGWPGSFLEVQKLLLPLTNPPPGLPAFHVIAPSIPGFGFSPAPTAPGFGLIEAGAAFNELMHQLGYKRYVVQGGDFGSHTARYMGAMFPDSVASILCNLWGVSPNATDLTRQEANQTTPAEDQYISFVQQSEAFTKAFWGIEWAVPLQMGILLGDSPVGNVVWPYFGMRMLAPGYEWGIEELITWGMMLYIPGPYGNVRIYAELKKASAHEQILKSQLTNM